MKSLLTIAIAIAGVALNQDTSKQTACGRFDSCSLQGKPKVHVAVDVGGLNEDLERAGISDEQLKTEAELLSRKFSDPVVENNAMDIYLQFDVTGLEMKPGG